MTENRILRQQITGRVRLSDGERKTLAEIGKKLGKQALVEVATIVTPDTILARQQQYAVGEYMHRLLRLMTPLTAEEMHNRVEFLSAWGAT